MMPWMAARAERLRALLAERILVLDGATGTYLQGRDLGPADFGGEVYEGCNEHLVLTRPDVVREMHEGYLAAGADLVETDTFGGTRIPLAEYGLAHKVREINATAARLATVRLESRQNGIDGDQRRVLCLKPR